jgi:putative pyruvate formate lyase activating enzyme
MIETYNVHNINFVTPDHFIPHILLIIENIKKEYPGLPILFNISGYQSIKILREIKDYVDIYLPDFKYADKKLAARLSLCPDYPGICLDAISEMIKQKGFLRLENSIAKKGVLVRHLILPGNIENSMDVLSILYGEFGKDLPISLMSQYKPITWQSDLALNRTLREEEFYKIYSHLFDLGFDNIFVQFPEETKKYMQFLPDFSLDQPFKGNLDKGFDTDQDL